MVQTEKINLRLTKDLRQKLETATKNCGVNMSKFIRSTLEREFAQNAH